MKYLTLRFDDARDNLDPNLFDLLEKYNIKADLGVITGTLDINVSLAFKTLSAKQLQNKNIVLIPHSNSHTKDTDHSDIDRCLSNPLFAKTNTNYFIVPYNKVLDVDIEKVLLTNNIYFISSKERGEKKTPSLIFNRIANKLFNSKHTNIDRMYLYYNNSKFNVNILAKSNELVYLPGMTYLNKINNDSFYKLINSLKNNECMTIVFHSVYKNPSDFEHDEYPEGCVSVDNLEAIIKYALANGVTIKSLNELIGEVNNG